MKRNVGIMLAFVAFALASCGSSNSGTSSPAVAHQVSPTTSSPATGGGGYTVSQAANDMAAKEPTSPWTNHAYDMCLATYMFKYMSPSAVKAYINGNNFPLYPNAIEKAAADNCVMAGVKQGPAFG